MIEVVTQKYSDPQINSHSASVELLPYGLQSDWSGTKTLDDKYLDITEVLNLMLRHWVK